MATRAFDAGAPVLPQQLDNNLSWKLKKSDSNVKPVSTLPALHGSSHEACKEVFPLPRQFYYWSVPQYIASEYQPQVYDVTLKADDQCPTGALIQPPGIFMTDRKVHRAEEPIIKEEDMVGLTESILTDYAKLISSVVDSLIQSKVDVDSIIVMITEKQKDSRCSKLYEASDMIHLFLLLKKEKYVTFFNHSLLVDIIQEFGDEKCEFVLRQFKAKFQSYCRNRVVQIPRSSWSDLGLEYDGETTSDQVEIVFKIDECFHSLSAERLHLFGGHVAKALGIDESMLILKSVKEGCVMVSYLLLVANIGELLSRLKTYYFYHEDYEPQKTLSVALIFSLKNHCDYRNLGFQMQLEPQKCCSSTSCWGGAIRSSVYIA